MRTKQEKMTRIKELEKELTFCRRYIKENPENNLDMEYRLWGVAQELKMLTGIEIAVTRPVRYQALAGIQAWGK